MPDPLENNAQEAKNQQNEEREKIGVSKQIEKELSDLKSSRGDKKRGSEEKLSLNGKPFLDLSLEKKEPFLKLSLEKGKPLLDLSLGKELKLSLEKGESLFEGIKAKLHDAFPTIPEDLTNKSINIRYKGENGVYRYILLYNDGIALLGKKSLAINKIGKSWNCSAKSTKRENGDSISVIEEFSFSEFNQIIDDIIKNADKCEIEIKDLDGPEIPTKE